MKALKFIQAASFIAILVAGTGEEWGNIAAIFINLAILGVSTYIIRCHEED